MSTPNSSLEKHAAAMGLTQEDSGPVHRVKPPVDTADKILLGVCCCLLAAGSAALSVWMIVPTLAISGIAAALLVRHLNIANSLPPRQWVTPEVELDGDWLLDKMQRDERTRKEKRNRDMVSNPLYRSMPINIHYDHHRHE